MPVAAAVQVGNLVAQPSQLQARADLKKDARHDFDRVFVLVSDVDDIECRRVGNQHGDVGGELLGDACIAKITGPRCKCSALRLSQCLGDAFAQLRHTLMKIADHLLDAFVDVAVANQPMNTALAEAVYQRQQIYLSCRRDLVVQRFDTRPKCGHIKYGAADHKGFADFSRVGR